MRLPFVLRSARLAATVLVAGLWMTGCGSSARPGSRQPDPQPVLFAHGTYFNEQVRAEAVLGPFRIAPTGTLDRTPPQPGDGEPIPITGGRFGSRGDRDAAGAAFPRGLGEEGAFGGREALANARPRAPGAAAGALPRQSLTVTLRSLAQEPISLRVVEVRSALGNFVPVPETFTLAPGATQDLEAMRASYPSAIDELELLLSLRRGSETQTQVLQLRPAGPMATSPVTR